MAIASWRQSRKPFDCSPFVCHPDRVSHAPIPNGRRLEARLHDTTWKVGATKEIEGYRLQTSALAASPSPHDRLQRAF